MCAYGSIRLQITKINSNLNFTNNNGEPFRQIKLNVHQIYPLYSRLLEMQDHKVMIEAWDPGNTNNIVGNVCDRP